MAQPSGHLDAGPYVRSELQSRLDASAPVGTLGAMHFNASSNRNRAANYYAFT
jgi:hypothetical protein